MRTDTSLMSFLNLKMPLFSDLKKSLKTDLRNSVGCCFEPYLSEARFIRRISAVSNSIQLSAAEMRQLIHTSNFCRI